MSDQVDVSKFFTRSSNRTKSLTEAKTTPVILVCIYNKNGTIITHDLLHTVFSTYGNILRILIFEKMKVWKAFIEYDNVSSALEAKRNLDDFLLFSDGSRMNIYFSSLDSIKFQNNNSGGVDYTLKECKTLIDMKEEQMRQGNKQGFGSQNIPEESEEKETQSNPTSPTGIKNRYFKKPQQIDEQESNEDEERDDDILDMANPKNLTKGVSGQINEPEHDDDDDSYESETEDDYYSTPFLPVGGNGKKNMPPNGRLIRQGSRSKTSYEIPIWQHEQVKQQEEYQQQQQKEFEEQQQARRQMVMMQNPDSNPPGIKKYGSSSNKQSDSNRQSGTDGNNSDVESQGTSNDASFTQIQQPQPTTSQQTYQQISQQVQQQAAPQNQQYYNTTTNTLAYQGQNTSEPQQQLQQQSQQQISGQQQQQQQQEFNPQQLISGGISQNTNNSNNNTQPQNMMQGQNMFNHMGMIPKVNPNVPQPKGMNATNPTTTTNNNNNNNQNNNNSMLQGFSNNQEQNQNTLIRPTQVQQGGMNQTAPTMTAALNSMKYKGMDQGISSEGYDQFSDEYSSPSIKQNEHNAKRIMEMLDKEMIQQSKSGLNAGDSLNQDEQQTVLNDINTSMRNIFKNAGCVNLQIDHGPLNLQNVDRNALNLLHSQLKLFLGKNKEEASLSAPTQTSQEDKKSPIIYVKGLNHRDMKVALVYNMFSNFGNIQKIIFIKKAGAALIEYENSEYGSFAKEYMDKVQLLGTPLKINFCSHSIINLRNNSQDPTEEVFIGSLKTHRFKKNKNVAVNPPSVTLHISNLVKEICSHDIIKGYFSTYGKIESMKFLFMEGSKNMCLLKMSSIEEALNTMVFLHDTDLGGRKAQIAFTRSKI